MLEVYWTAFELRAYSLEVRDRSFDFRWRGKNRKCRFEKTTEDALRFAKHCYPIGNASSTDHRNVVSFNLLANGVEFPRLNEPVSFFVDCDGIDETELLDFLRHLNAYMLYFDRRSPRILLHSLVDDSFKENDRFREGSFPAKVVSRELDKNLISYWTEAFETKDPLMRYLLMYRILEYASFNYIDGATLQAVRREISKPSLPSRIDLTAKKLAEIFAQTKEIESIQRTQNAISSLVDLDKLWACIEINLDYFSKDQVFEGGYTVKALLSGKCDCANWRPNGVRGTFDRLRQLRNALAHGQDGSTRGTVLPTQKNANLIVPWLNILETISSDVMFLQEH